MVIIAQSFHGPPKGAPPPMKWVGPGHSGDARSLTCGACRTPGRRPRDLLVRMIRTADQWPGLHVPEPHLQPQAPERRERLRRHITPHGDMLRRWPQVLAQGEDIT